jgi:hypothetical protein
MIPRSLKFCGVASSMLFSASQAFAHNAPSGWAYDPACCSDRDCYEVSDDAVAVVPGGWRIKATGEVFRQLDVRQSQDGHFHRCSLAGRGDTRTICLYVPPMSY